MQTLVPVVSSNISAIGYDQAQQVMRVKFTNGSVYDYQHVPKEVHDKIMNADSVGSTFNKEVKSKPSIYPFAKV